MTDQKPNCGTCPYFPDDEHCPIEYPTDQYNAQRITSLCGCIINPDARAYLMADVIKGLEQLYQRAVKAKDIPRYMAYDRAITLVKAEVK